MQTASNLFQATSNFGLRLQSFRYEAGLHYPDHTHDDLSIVVCTSGMLESVQFGTIVHLRAGEVLVTNRHTIHASRYCIDGNPTEGVTIDLDYAAANRICGLDANLPSLQVSTTRLFGSLAVPRAFGLALDIRRELASNQPGFHMLAECLAIQICIEVLRSWPKEMVRQHDGHTSRSMPRWQFIRTIEFMYSHAKSPALDWTALASNLGQTDFHNLKSEFAQTTGLSLEDCHRQIVLGRARDLIDTRQWSMARTARVLGFDNGRQLSRLLRR
jgi:AraC-like DNA-binding protein